MVQDIRVKREMEEEPSSLEDLLQAIKTGSASRKEQARIYDFIAAILPFVSATIRLPYALGEVGWFVGGGPVEREGVVDVVDENPDSTEKQMEIDFDPAPEVTPDA